MSKVPNRVTPEGRLVGENNARLIQPAIDRLIAEGEPDERCKTCAFRPGTVPNGCLQTQMDAIKCVIEGVRFTCHHDPEHKMTCHGWYAARVAVKGRIGKVAWDFSPPDEDEAQKERSAIQEEGA